MDGPTKFFFGLEKKNGQNRNMHSLTSESGMEIINPKEIRKRAVDFYSELYKSEHVEVKDIASKFYVGLPKVPDRANVELEKPFTKGELYDALKSMECGKAPGIDGIPVEFYKSLWAVLGDDLLEVLNDSLTRGSLPTSCRRAVITLLPKKGNLRNIKNWRPVSLLCSDMKILSKALAVRLRDVIGGVIHIDQTYCVPNRSIFDNIHLIRDILDISGLLGLNFGLISLDQEKAFDRVEHNYLWQTLGEFGFSPGFIKMIGVLYVNIESVLKINGGLSAPFKITRGIRQGCALSGMLYALAIEPLLLRIRASIDGWSIPQSECKIKLSAYADDIIVMIKNQKEVDMLHVIINDFGKMSSAKVNWIKSEAIVCGKWEGRCFPKLPGGLEWKKSGFKYLGVYLGDDSMMQKNWEGVLEKTKGRLEKWRWLWPKMSFRGRVTVINNLVASTFWHRLACTEPPSGLLAKLQAIIVDFFWTKFHWVPQSVLYLPREEGGQGLIHLVSRGATFRLQFIQRLLAGPEDLVWRNIANFILRQAGGLGLDSTLFLLDSSKIQVNGLTPFFKGIFRVWSLFKRRRGVSESLHWLLEEPTVLGSRFDVSSEIGWGFENVMCTSRKVQLHHLIVAGGPELNNSEGVASCLSLKSERLAGKLLEVLKQKLTVEEKSLLLSYGEGKVFPNKKDPFPELYITPDLKGANGEMLENIEDLSFHEADRKKIYRSCVKVLNKKTLNGRVETVWRDKLGFDTNVKPGWRILYKPPLEKRVGDLQWRILHGAVAVNSFVSVINPNVCNVCPFCEKRETIFHCFMECTRLGYFFDFLKLLFRSLNEVFTVQIFILGYPYAAKNRIKCQLLNFIIGEAKMAIYLSRRNKIEGSEGCEVISILKNRIKSRVWIDFKFYKMMKDLSFFFKPVVL
uniref:Reverse transcriptase domain-containing protein n=1 Tax=Cyprinus carpio TaxID=7962 RepID=A0A8C1S2L1_CYPCA